jgi:hypothetical protein
MGVLNDNAIHLKFLLGLPVYIEGIGNFYAPSLTEIVDLTEENYNMAVSSLLFDKSQLENNEELNEYSNFQVLLSILQADESFQGFFFYGLNLHLDNPPILHPEGIIYFGELSKESILTEDKFDYIKRLVRIANNIPEKKAEEEYKAGNERAKKFIEKMKKQREEISKVKKQKINLHSMISAVGWKAESFDFISKLNIYQLYDGFYRLEVIDNYNYTMTGIYTGNIDGSKIKLADVNWANIIK